MTLARSKDDAMTPGAKSEQQARAIDSAQRRKELNLGISQLVAETINGGHDCKIARCRMTAFMLEQAGHRQPKAITADRWHLRAS
jgi:c-di-AMP phosphodiesterase-like protein